MNPRYAVVALRALHRCEYCHAPEMVFNFPFEVEHIIPLARDGEDEEVNWTLACRSCNVHKSIRLHYEDPETGEVALLFHPRQDRWEEHFRLAFGTGSIAGISPTGRATAACLKMNSDAQLVARQQWIRLGIFP